MKRIRNFLSSGRPKSSDKLPTLTLADYAALTATIAPPTDQQKDNFAKFVSHAHSWYKHLPLCLPGVKFRFFIDPSAGCERATTFMGKVTFKPRVKQGFHYSWIPTDEYRRRFGYLAYSYRMGPKAFDIRWNRFITPSDNVAAIPANGRLYALPLEVSQAGAVRLTAAMNNYSAECSHWRLLVERNAADLFWPEESGGREVLQKIIARADEMSQEGFPFEDRERINRVRIDNARFVDEPELLYVDPELYELIAPEQGRQRSEMIKAMQRVCDLIYT